MRSLIWIFAGRTWPKVRFLTLRRICGIIKVYSFPQGMPEKKIYVYTWLSSHSKNESDIFYSLKLNFAVVSYLNHLSAIKFCFAGESCGNYYWDGLWQKSPWSNKITQTEKTKAVTLNWSLRSQSPYLLLNINEDNQEMPQSRSTALPKHQKKRRWGTNNDKTVATYMYETIHAQRRTAKEEPPWNGQ